MFGRALDGSVRPASAGGVGPRVSEFGPARRDMLRGEEQMLRESKDRSAAGRNGRLRQPFSPRCRPGDGQPVEEAPPIHLFCDQIASELGTIIIVALEGRLASLDYEDCRLRMTASLTARYGRWHFHHARDPYGLSTRIRAYLAGDLAAIDQIRVVTGGTPFQCQVWTALRAVPAGTTVAYGDLARTLGRPYAARAVGAANGQNPVAIVVPCHRMLDADARLTGYAGGIWRKRWLLSHEGAYPLRAGAVGAHPSSRRGL